MLGSGEKERKDKVKILKNENEMYEPLQAVEEKNFYRAFAIKDPVDKTHFCW